MTTSMNTFEIIAHIRSHPLAHGQQSFVRTSIGFMPLIHFSAVQYSTSNGGSLKGKLSQLVHRATGLIPVVPCVTWHLHYGKYRTP